MKYSSIISILFISLFCFCENDHDLRQVYADQVSYGGCKTGATKSDYSEYIEFETVNTYYLQINHIDVWFNCEPGKLLVDAGLNNDTIVVSENEQSSLVNCICPYDLTYRIGPLHYDQYLIMIQRDGYVYTEFSVDFNSSTYGVFEID